MIVHAPSHLAKRLAAAIRDAGRTSWGRKLSVAGLMGLYGLLVYTLVGFLLAPRLAERAVALELSQVLGRAASVESVRCNPFTFTLEVRNFRVLEPDGSQTFAGFDLLRVNLDPFWFLAKRLSVRELTLRKPVVRLARDDHGRLNVADLFAGPEKGSAGESFTWTPPDFSYSLTGISLTDGVAVFEDALKGTRHELTDLNFAVGSLASGQPGLREVFSTSGMLNRSHVTLTVHADLSRDAPEARLRLDVENLALDRYTPYLYVAKAMDARAARLGLAASLGFPAGSAGRQAPVLEAQARIEDVELLLEDAPVMRLDSLTVQGARFDLAGRKLRVERVEFGSPVVHVDRDGAGSMNLSRIAGQDASEGRRDRNGSPGVAVSVDEAVVRNGRFAFEDKGLELVADLAGVEAALTGLDAAAGRIESLKLSAEADMLGKLTLEAGGAYDPPDLTGRVALAGLDLGKWEALARRFVPRIALSGQADLEVRCGLSGGEGGIEPAFSAQISAKDLRLGREGRQKPYLAVQNLHLTQADVRPAARTVAVGQVTLSGAAASLVRDASGRLDLADVLPPGGQGSQGPAWTVRVKELALSDSTVEYAEPGGALRLGLSKVSVKDFDSAQAKPMEVSAQGNLDGKAAFSVAGQVTAGRPWVGARLEVSGLPLATVAGFVPSLPVSVKRGELDVAGDVQAGLEQGALKAGFAGRAAVRGLAVAQPGGDAPLAELGELSVEGARLGLSPLECAIERLTLADPRLRLTLDKNGAPVWPGPSRAKPQAAPEAKASAAAGSGSPASPAYAIGTLTVRGGSVTAAFQGFDQPFSAYAWDIRLTGQNIRPGQAATISLGALVGHSGRLKAEGRAGWVNASPVLDLRANLDGLDLGELSPVSRRFTGFPVTRGKMDLALDYKTGDKGFDLKNKAVITGIQLGPKQSRPGGKDIPLDLAVSLLTDSKGVITLDIPVSGGADGLKVDLRSVISTAVGGAISKILFSPLAFLNVSRSGGSTVRVAFQPGTTVLAPEGEKTLAELAAAVLPRPRIKLEIAAYVDVGGESEALAQALAAGAKAPAEKAAPAKPGFLSRLRKAPPPPPPPPAPAPEAGAIEEYARRLAGERLAAVRLYLVEKANFPEDRIFPLSVDPFSPPKAADAPNWRADITLGR